VHNTVNSSYVMLALLIAITIRAKRWHSQSNLDNRLSVEYSGTKITVNRQ